MIPTAVDRPSPNSDARPPGRPPDLLILHYTGMRTCEAALERLCDRDAKVSAHYCIDEDGGLYALVPEERRAWHAGVSAWEGERDVNARSIGIELVNPGHDFGYRPFPEAQIASLVALAGDIVARYQIAPWHVLGHSDVAPARKSDPGELFPWRRLAEEGIGLWIEPPAMARGAAADCPVADLRDLLADFGYDVAPHGCYDAAVQAAVTALQRHWRPACVDGVADAQTVAILQALVDRKRQAVCS